MALPSIKVLMSCVMGFAVVYFCKIFLDLGVNAFVTNFFPTSTAALFPTSKAFFAPSLATVLPTSRAEDAICLAALLVKILSSINMRDLAHFCNKVIFMLSIVLCE